MFIIRAYVQRTAVGFETFGPFETADLARETAAALRAKGYSLVVVDRVKP